MADEKKPSSVTHEAVIVVTSTEDKKVKVDFGESIRWITMTYDQALEFANLLVEKAKDVQPKLLN